MNYRHGYHAGNHADVLKHAILAFALARLAAKDKPFAVLDSHAGRGVYDLSGAEAQRTGEYRDGVARLLAAAEAPEALAPYLAAVLAANGGGPLRLYPGSPLIVQAALRARDRYAGCELHPAEAAALRAALAGDRRMQVRAEDGYAALRALLPPPERRGLVLIDPPFEAADEFARLAAAVKDAVRRWPSGTYLIWYPAKDGRAARAFETELASQGVPDMVVAALAAGGDGPGLQESRVLAIRPPWPFETAFAPVLPWLARTLAQGAGASGTLARLTPEAP